MTAVDTPPAPHPSGARRRPFLGFRRHPGRLALAVFRLPLHLYRHGMGWLLGRTFVVVVHVGRKTGQRHETAAMVLRYDGDTGEAMICSAWGPDTDWIRNLRAQPAVEVRLARASFTPQQRFLTDEEGFAVVVDFRRRHPWRLRLVSRVLGLGDLRRDTVVHEFVTTHPFVSFQPATPP